MKKNAQDSMLESLSETQLAHLRGGPPMTDEARELLSITLEYLPSDASVRHKIRTFLAQPIPAAREAVLAERLEALLDVCDRFARWHPADSTVQVSAATSNARAALADTSPAAAALLAQGERLRAEESDLRMVAAHLELLEDGPDVSDYLLDALLIMRRALKARAALAPGEPDGD